MLSGRALIEQSRPKVFGKTQIGACSEYLFELQIVKIDQMKYS